ncbi:hypothetical protein [Lactococcus garvieae]
MKIIKKIIVVVIGLLSIIFSLTAFILGFEYIHMGTAGMLNEVMNNVMNITSDQENQIVTIIVGVGWFLLIGGFASFTCSLGWITSLPLQKLIEEEINEKK